MAGSQHQKHEHEGHDEEGQEAQVMLGFVEPVDVEENGPLLPEDFCSKMGGLPIWLNPEQVLESKETLCDQCSKPMSFLLQLYSPEDHPEEAFHRVVYVFCCKSGACHKKSSKGCFKVVRSQLPQYNPYYSPVSKDAEDAEDAEEMNKGWEPKPASEHEHQTLHWTKGLHKQLCGTNPPNSQAATNASQEINADLADLSISNKNGHSSEDEDEDDEDAKAKKQKRSQLPTRSLTREEQEYANRLDIDFKLVERIARFPELEIISEPEVFDEQDIEDGLAYDSSGDEQEAEEGWEARAEALRLKKEKKKAAATKDQNGVSQSLQTAEASMNSLVPVGDEVYENTKTDIDPAFLTFQKRIALYPDQVLRYARMEYELTNPEPLYVNDIGTPTPEDIPSCPDCGGERTFEFQILPQLLNHLKIDHSAADALDFGTVLVYSCKDNCHVPNKHYQHEIAFVQHFSEDGMQGTNMTFGPEASVASAK
ncbi:Programmed cell death protein 2 [Lunasporangiospora selenospora]|uniref:Programmed cell death protein 2 n=1 Tax=Lunasporangiospora selenospora TaxID=979761 RepID=A0A9P6FVV7_9FUNG|nr:Programmed cell death protein 2 [Lunasporangiospora selenospora]